LAVGGTFCTSGFCSKWGWCGPGLPSHDGNGAHWEDHSALNPNDTFSFNKIPMNCLEVLSDAIPKDREDDAVPSPLDNFDTDDENVRIKKKTAEPEL
jgi:hypothetical protein